MKKRILAWLLVCLMVVSALPVTAFAQDEAACPGYENKHTLTNCAATKIDTVDPTCREWGYTLYQCDSCDEYFAADFIKYGPEYHVYELVTPGKAPTCTEPGSTDYYQCFCLTDKGGAVLPATGHKYEVIEEYGDCLTGYYKLVRCSVCEDEVETVVEKGHSWSDAPTAIIKQPLCNEDGLAEYTCTVCEITKQVVIRSDCDYVDHIWVLTEGVDPTCTATGIADHYVCSICSAKAIYNENAKGSYIIINSDDDLILPALGHDMVSKYKDPIYPTCTEKGHDVYVCTRCDYTVDNESPALGHDFTSRLAVLVDYVEGGCKVERTATYRCSRCDETYTFNFGFQHEWTVKYDIKPTCTTWGGIAYFCLHCGEDNPEVQKFEPTGHDYDDGVITVEPTCLKDGKKTYTCQNGCGDSYTEVVPATGHASKHAIHIIGNCIKQNAVMTVCQRPNCDGEKVIIYTAEDGTEYDVRLAGEPVCVLTFEQRGFGDHEYDSGVINEPTCTEAGNGADWCIHCNEWGGYDIPATGHKWVAKQKTETLPTCTEDGHWVFICEYCGETEDRGQPATGHVPGEEVIIDPTCCTPGYSVIYCTVCDAIISSYNETYFDFDKQRPDYNGKLIDWYYDSVEDASKEHTGIDLESRTIFREGTCIIIGLYRYTCNDCNHGVLVVIEGTGEGHAWVQGDLVSEADCENAATYNFACFCGATKVDTVGDALGHLWNAHEYVAPTCLETGMMAYIQCDRCLEYKNKPAGDLVIPALGHDWVGYDYKEPTCTEDGNLAYTQCSRCLEIKNKPAGGVILPALGHDLQIVDSGRTTCTAYGYAHYDCVRCEHFYEDGAIAEEEYICGYQPAFGHNWIEKPAANEPTCTEPGNTAGKYCTMCRTLEVEPTEIPALGHQNKDGVELTGKCTDPEDDLCVNCNEHIGHEHTYVFVREVPATCKDYGYELWVCLWCEAHEAWNIDDSYLAGHTWGNWYIVEAPSFISGGVERRDCQICDEYETREIGPKTGLVYTISVNNILGDELAIVNGSIVEVVISVEGKGVDVWGLNYEFNFDDAVMQLADVEILDSPFALHNYNVVGDTINFVATPAGGNVDTVIDSKIDLAVLTFKVDCFGYSDILGEYITADIIAETELSVTGIQALDSKGNKLITENDLVDVDVRAIMDVNADSEIDMVDAYDIYDIIIGNMEYDYLEAADLDQDGDVDMDDFVNIYNFILGTVSYDELIDAIVAE